VTACDPARDIWSPVAGGGCREIPRAAIAALALVAFAAAPRPPRLHQP
jgi:hypothetical protein